MYDAIIIGGGIVGASLAYHLVRGGVHTLLLDRRDAGRATAAGAGILAPEASSYRLDTWFNLAVEAVAYYPDLVAQLRADGVEDSSYAVCGKLTVAIADEELEKFAETESLVFGRQRERGTPDADDLRLVSNDEAQLLFPPLAPVRRAFYYENAARIDGRQFTEALLTAGERHGLIIKQASVEQLIIDGYLVEGVVADGERITAGMIAIAGGAWSDQFAEQLMYDIPVYPQRGQIIHLRVPDTETEQWPIIGSRRGYYLVCGPEGRVAVGATHDKTPGFRYRSTAEGVRTLLDELLWVAPGLAHAEIVDIRVGLRPKVKDRLPVLGRSPGINNLYLATGHGSSGLQLGPYTAKLIAQLMRDGESEYNLAPFRMERFF